MGMEGGDQGRAEITVSYLHHNMNDSAEKKQLSTLWEQLHIHN